MLAPPTRIVILSRSKNLALRTSSEFRKSVLVCGLVPESFTLPAGPWFLTCIAASRASASHKWCMCCLRSPRGPIHRPWLQSHYHYRMGVVLRNAIDLFSRCTIQVPRVYESPPMSACLGITIMVPYMVGPVITSASTCSTLGLVI